MRLTKAEKTHTTKTKTTYSDGMNRDGAAFIGWLRGEVPSVEDQAIVNVEGDSVTCIDDLKLTGNDKSVIKKLTSDDTDGDWDDPILKPIDLVESLGENTIRLLNGFYRRLLVWLWILNPETHMEYRRQETQSYWDRIAIKVYSEGKDSPTRNYLEGLERATRDFRYDGNRVVKKSPAPRTIENWLLKRIMGLPAEPFPAQIIEESVSRGRQWCEVVFLYDEYGEQRSSTRHVEQYMNIGRTSEIMTWKDQNGVLFVTKHTNG